MTSEMLKDTIKRELPALIRQDSEIRTYILELIQQESAPRQVTEDRFDRILGELRAEREKQTERWEAQEKKWEAQEKKWEAQDKKWEAQEKKWEAQDKKWEEEKRRWEESQRHFEQVHQEIMAQANKFDRSIGALGARWGTQSEKAFRDALAGILEKSFGVQVLNVSVHDDEGSVFGRPDQVELDVIIKNGLLVICELKSSIGKADMYIFERKARFYERYYKCQANRLIVISPMIEPKALRVAQQLGIETYGDSCEVERL